MDLLLGRFIFLVVFLSRYLLRGENVSWDLSCSANLDRQKKECLHFRAESDLTLTEDDTRYAAISNLCEEWNAGRHESSFVGDKA